MKHLILDSLYRRLPSPSEKQLSKSRLWQQCRTQSPAGARGEPRWLQQPGVYSGMRSLVLSKEFLKSAYSPGSCSFLFPLSSHTWGTSQRGGEKEILTFVHDAFSQRDFLGPDSCSKVQEIRRPSADAPQCFLLWQELGSGVSSVGWTVTTNFICSIYFPRPGHTPQFSSSGILPNTFC